MMFTSKSNIFFIFLLLISIFIACDLTSNNDNDSVKSLKASVLRANSVKITYDVNFPKDSVLMPDISLQNDTLNIVDFWAMADEPTKFSTNVNISGDTVIVSYSADSDMFNDWQPTMKSEIALKVNEHGNMIYVRFEPVSFGRAPFSDHEPVFRNCKELYIDSISVK